MNINHERLVPGAITYWGDVVGDITDQQDLVDYIASHGGGGSGDATWGSIQGTLSDQQDLMNEFDKDRKRLNDLEDGIVVPVGTATESWVQNQGYLVQDDLSQYATRQWVTGRGYATEDWVSNDYTNTVVTGAQEKAEENVKDWVVEEGYINQIKTVNNQSLVGTGNVEISGLTPEQEEAIAPLEEVSEGAYYTTKLKANAGTRCNSNARYYNIQNHMYVLNGEIYGFFEGVLYKYNVDSLSFSEIGYFSPYSYMPLWNDASGRIYMGTSYELDIDAGTSTSINMQAGWYDNSNSYIDNLIKGHNGYYISVGTGYGNSKKFNEQTQEFEAFEISWTDAWLDIGLFSRYCTEYEGHIIYVSSGNMYELIEGDNDATIVKLDDPYFDVQAGGNYYEFNDWTVFVESGEDHFLLSQYDSYKLDSEGHWVSFRILLNYSPVYYGGNHIVTDKYVLGPSGNTQEYTFDVFNFSDEDVFLTGWSPVGNIAVDLTSNQTIKGEKTFSGSVHVGNMYVMNVMNESESLNIYSGKLSISAEGGIDINNSGTGTYNGNDIATTNQCLLNREYENLGPRFNREFQIPETSNYMTFETHDGRMFIYGEDGNMYEYGGPGTNSLNQVNIGVTIPNGFWVFTCSSDTFFIDGDIDSGTYGYTYRWDDVSEEFVYICTFESFSNDYGNFYTNGGTLCYGSDKILLNDPNDGTWGWNTRSTPNNVFKYSLKSLVMNGGYTYIFSNDGMVYLYEEDENGVGTYTAVTHFTIDGNNNIFRYGGEMYYTYSDKVYKLDLTKGPNEYPDENDMTDIYCAGSYRLYFDCGDGDRLITTDTGNYIGYAYGMTEYVIDTPSYDYDTGINTYVLQATVDENEHMHYEWVPVPVQGQ